MESNQPASTGTRRPAEPATPDASPSGALAPAASFGALLRRFRQRAGLTQEELAERANLSARAVSDLERGVRSRPWTNTVALLGDALGLTAEERRQLEGSVQRLRGTPSGLPSHPASGRVPAPLTPLVGRQWDVAEAAHRLRWGGVRLLTLTGAGGVGKTRVAIELASTLLPDFPDGVAFVSLAPLKDDRLVAAALLDALGLKEGSGRSTLETVISHLQERDMLLVLDNFEHLIAAAGLLTEILRGCRRVRMLVTSRQALRVEGEHRMEIAPLEVPGRGALGNPESAARYPAVELFVQRARAARRAFELSAGNLEAVVEICRRLDGLPLAIELAAARITLLPPQALLMRLDQRLRVLTEGASDLPDRQQTMRDAIAWGYHLLDEPAQRLFRRLSVFVGGWSLDSVETLTRAEGTDLYRSLGALVDSSLVVVEEQDTPRYRMLETIREFAQEMLEAQGETFAARDRHLTYFRELAEKAELQLTGPEQATWLARLEDERDNLFAALQWAHEQGRWEEGLRLVSSLQLFWEGHGPVGEARRWLEIFLAAGQEALQEDRRLHAKTLRTLGRLCWLQGDNDRADGLLRQALSLITADDEPAVAARLLNHLAGIAHDGHDFTRAMNLYQEALPLAVRAGDRWQIAAVYTNLGNLAADMGELAQAAGWLHQGLGLVNELGEKRVIGMNLNVLGEVFRVQGLFDRAAATFRDALRLLYEVTDRVNLAYSLECLARVARDQQAMVRAARLLEGADMIYLQCGVGHHDPAVQVIHDEVLADCERVLGISGTTAAREEGAAMTLEQVVAYALEDAGAGSVETA